MATKVLNRSKPSVPSAVAKAQRGKCDVRLEFTHHLSRKEVKNRLTKMAVEHPEWERGVKGYQESSDGYSTTCTFSEGGCKIRIDTFNQPGQLTCEVTVLEKPMLIWKSLITGTIKGELTKRMRALLA